jgi:hypothetical protein
MFIHLKKRFIFVYYYNFLLPEYVQRINKYINISSNNAERIIKCINKSTNKSTQVQQNGIVNDRKRMKTVENGYRYDDRLRCTGKRRNNLLNDGRLRLPFTCHRKR